MEKLPDKTLRVGLFENARGFSVALRAILNGEVFEVIRQLRSRLLVTSYSGALEYQNEKAD